MDGSVLAFLKCTGGSVWTHLNGTYGSVLSHLRFSTQSAFTRFPQSGNSGDHCYYARKATKLPIWHRMLWLLSNTEKYSPNCRANTENQLFEYCPPRKDNTGSITFPSCSRYISPYIPSVNWSVGVGGGRCFGYRPNFLSFSFLTVLWYYLVKYMREWMFRFFLRMWKCTVEHSVALTACISWSIQGRLGYTWRWQVNGGYLLLCLSRNLAIG